MNRFEGDNLRHVTRNLLQQFFQMVDVIVPEDVLRHLTVANTLNHRCMIAAVRENVAVGQCLGQREQRRVVRHVARCKQKCRFLLMETSQLCFESLVQWTCTGDVARATRTRTVCCHCITENVEDVSNERSFAASVNLHDGFLQLGMLTETKVIVAAPDGDGARVAFVVQRALLFGLRKEATFALHTLEHAVGIVAFLRFDLLVEELIVFERVLAADLARSRRTDCFS